MSKDIYFGNNARDLIFSGIEKTAKAVMLTMGPKGRNVILDREGLYPLITNDGVSIVKDISLSNPLENIGVKLLKECANNTNDIAGDGTSTATLLTYAIIKEGFRYLKTGINPVELKEGMSYAGKLVSNNLKANSELVDTKEKISQVATISSQDKEVGNIISEAIDKVGKNGVISIDTSNTFGLSLEFTEGMEFDSGYISPYMINNNNKMLSEFNDVLVLITDEKIVSTKSIIGILEAIIQNGHNNLVIIADDIEGEVLNSLILNKAKGIINVLGIKAPGFGDDKKEFLKDLSALTGSTFITKDLSLKLENITFNDLGFIKNIKSNQDNTTIISSDKFIDLINERVSILKNQINNTKNEYEIEKVNKRLAKLSGGVAVIKVGASTETEVMEKKLRVEDALNSTRSAIEEGVVAGGGVALLSALEVLNIDLDSESKNIGVEIVKKALSYPIKTISENAGISGDVVIYRISNMPYGFGLNLYNGNYENLIENGIVDPCKVERIALEQAISLAGTFLTTERCIFNEIIDK